MMSDGTSDGDGGGEESAADELYGFPGGGGFLEIRYREGFRTPPLFKMVCWGVLRGFFDASTPFVGNFFGGVILGCISTVLSLPPMQPLLI